MGESYSDFAKAIGLFADEIGCGAFCYLRRVFESLIEEKHKECVVAEGEKWNEEDYQKKHVNERIELLEGKGYEIIPNEIRHVKDQLYRVLSIGVHECSDDLCVELFPFVKYAIEVILDAKIKKREKDEKIKALPKQFDKKLS